MIYLDYAASHPMTSTALQAYAEAAALVGNPASVHVAGQAAREKLEEGRGMVAAAIGVDPRTLLCNSGATEGNNQAIVGVARQWQAQHGRTGHLISTPTEHLATLAPLRELEQQGWRLSWLTPDVSGRYDPAELSELLQTGGTAKTAHDTALVSLHYVNNELGSVQNIAEMSAICQAAGVPLHCDAVQAAGVLPIEPEVWGVSLLTLSAHKWGGPRGVGFLYVERGLQLAPLLVGGGQESGKRAGTQNTAGVYAAGVSLQQAEKARPQTWQHLQALRQQAETAIRQAVLEVRCNHPVSDPIKSCPKIMNITLPNSDGEALLMNLDILGISLSSGSACSAGTMQASHVLTALGHSSAEALASLRLSFGAATTASEIDQASSAIAQAAAASQL